MISIVSNYIYYFPSFQTTNRMEREEEEEDKWTKGKNKKKHSSHRVVVNDGEERTDSRRTRKQIQENQP